MTLKQSENRLHGFLLATSSESPNVGAEDLHQLSNGKKNGNAGRTEEGPIQQFNW
ncbi:hypothetical protein NC652_001565 [Populus alba x Populus x berolinensis]|nr:hypothetical protein NC652_001565 [Populus alba x Populus x berolinensis]